MAKEIGVLRRLLIGVFCCSVVMATGCQTGTGPFGAGATQIPPPPTGAASRNDPYYQPTGQSIGRSGTGGDPAYMARNNRRARFSSDDNSSSGGTSRDSFDTRGQRDDRELLEPQTHNLPDADLGSADVIHNRNLPWIRPAEALVSPATAYESSRVRPRFR